MFRGSGCIAQEDLWMSSWKGAIASCESPSRHLTWGTERHIKTSEDSQFSWQLLIRGVPERKKQHYQPLHCSGRCLLKVRDLSVLTSTFLTYLTFSYTYSCRFFQGKERERKKLCVDRERKNVRINCVIDSYDYSILGYLNIFFKTKQANMSDFYLLSTSWFEPVSLFLVD